MTEPLPLIKNYKLQDSATSLGRLKLELLELLMTAAISITLSDVNTMYFKIHDTIF